jgi:flagellar motor switch protein FliN/FliY
MANDIKMLLDVTMPVSVQLGQTKMTVRELLELKKGSVVELTRMAGESVDIFIGGRLLAKGEVTVVDDRLAIRVAQLFGEKEKFKHL